MDNKYNENRENKENLIDITGIVDDLIKGAIHMKWKFLVLIILCTGLICGYKRLTYSPYYVASSTLPLVPAFPQSHPIHISIMLQPIRWPRPFLTY